MAPDGQIYAAPHRRSRFHHSSFLAARSIAGAGELKVTDGKLVGVTNKSGHYRPDEHQLYHTLIELEKAFGQRLSGVEVRVVTKDNDMIWPGGAREFIRYYERSNGLR